MSLYYRKGYSGAWVFYGNESSNPYRWAPLNPPADQGRYEFCAQAWDKAGNPEPLCSDDSSGDEESNFYDYTPPTVDVTATPDAPDIRLTWSAVDPAPSASLAACRGVVSVS